MKAPSKSVVFVVGIAFSVLLPLLDLLLNFTDKIERSAIFQFLVGLAIFLATLLATYISWLLEKIELHSQKQSTIQGLLNNLSVSIVQGKASFYPIDKEELYKKLEVLVGSATEHLRLMYLGDRPPEKQEKFEPRNLYINALNDVIDRGSIRVTRLILLSQENKKWLRSIVKKNQGKQFFSLYVILNRPVPAISIQVIDELRTLLINDARSVALKRKHVFIDDSEAALIFKSLYINIAHDAVAIIRDGVLEAENFEKYLKTS